METIFDVPLTTYQLKDSDTVVFLEVLSCADSSLVGLQVENSTIIQMDLCDFLSLTEKLYGDRAVGAMREQLFHYGLLKGDESLILLETIGRCSRQDIFNGLKLYKRIDIYPVDMIAYRYNSKIKQFWHGSVVKFISLYRRPENEIPEPYTLTPEEKEKFPQWYTEHKKLIQKNVSPRFREILQLSFESYRIGRMNASFVMLFVILEMLYSDKGSKIAKSIAQGVSKLLGSSEKDKRPIRTDIFGLYDKRSRYVHDGKSVEVQDLFDLREYVRRVIVEIFDQGKDDDVLNFVEEPKVIYKSKIVEFCQEQHMSLSDISKLTSISEDQLNKIVSGKYDISFSQAIRIAKVLNKSVEQVFIMN